MMMMQIPIEIAHCTCILEKVNMSNFRCQEASSIVNMTIFNPGHPCTFFFRYYFVEECMPMFQKNGLEYL